MERLLGGIVSFVRSWRRRRRRRRSKEIDVVTLITEKEDFFKTGLRFFLDLHLFLQIVCRSRPIYVVYTGRY